MNLKKIFLLSSFLFTILSFAQQKQFVKLGYITFLSNSILDFKNLTIDTENVTYYNDVLKSNTSFALESIKKIVDGSGVIVYPTKNQNVVLNQNETTMMKKDSINIIQVEKLVYKSSSNIMFCGKKLSTQELENLFIQNQSVYNLYTKGKNQKSLGDIFMGGGIGLFLGGALVNLSKTQTEEEIMRGESKKGSPALLIIGIATTIIGIPIKIGGVQKIKESVGNYNSSIKKVASVLKPEFKFIAGGNGLGFQLKF
jgi:hypothetical protein